MLRFVVVERNFVRSLIIFGNHLLVIIFNQYKYIIAQHIKLLTQSPFFVGVHRCTRGLTLKAIQHRICNRSSSCSFSHRFCSSIKCALCNQTKVCFQIVWDTPYTSYTLHVIQNMYLITYMAYIYGILLTNNLLLSNLFSYLHP